MCVFFFNNLGTGKSWKFIILKVQQDPRLISFKVLHLEVRMKCILKCLIIYFLPQVYPSVGTNKKQACSKLITSMSALSTGCLTGKGRLTRGKMANKNSRPLTFMTHTKERV